MVEESRVMEFKNTFLPMIAPARTNEFSGMAFHQVKAKKRFGEDKIKPKIEKKQVIPVNHFVLKDPIIPF